MGLLGLLMLLHAVVIGGFVAARALHAKLSPVGVPALELSVGGASFENVLSAAPSGRQLEEYVEAGMADLRIMLVQDARRRRE